MSYLVCPYDNPQRWIVQKPNGEAELVELDYYGKDAHGCSCKHYEFSSDRKNNARCKHVRLVLEHLKL